MENRQIFTVSQINTAARTVLEQFTIWIQGEVDEYQDGYKSAVYLKLKDDASILPAMFWKFSDVGYLPKNGDKVVVFGTLTLYEKTGKFQLLISKIELFGEGDLLKAKEALKKKLYAEGYFAEDHKKLLPKLPQKIGLITSKRGAAIQDFLTNLVKHYQGFDIYLADTLVQGDAAAKSICDSIEALGSLPLDVIVVTRGGGDATDLMCFDNENVVKAIYNCPVPVISAVGHEVDFTLCDLVSDMRVSTPTKAAELISADYFEFVSTLNNLFEVCNLKFHRLVSNFILELDSYLLVLEKSWSNYKTLPAELNQLHLRITSYVEKQYTQKGLQLKSTFDIFSALGPEQVLKRGYSIAYTSEGTLAKSAKMLQVGDTLSVKFSDGTVVTKVSKTS